MNNLFDRKTQILHANPTLDVILLQGKVVELYRELQVKLY